MSGAPTASLLVLLTLAVVLAVSGVAKLRDPLSLEDALVALRAPSALPRRTTARVVPWVEVVLAVLLLISPAPTLLVVAAIAGCLMLAYTALVARALGFDSPVDCSCFGGLGSQRVDRSTVARNVLLLALAVVVVLVAADGGSVPAAVRSLGTAGWTTLAAAVAAVVVAVLVVGGGRGAVDEAPDGEPALDYERTPIPWGVLRRPDGSTATLVELASTQARLLVVLNAHCGPCVRTAEKLDGWAAALAPAVGVLAVYAEEGLASAHSEELTVVEPDLNVRRIFSVGAPGAVLLGADGLMAGGPVAGAGDVERFVEEILDELARSTPPADG